MKVTKQIAKKILDDKDFRLGLCLALKRSEDRVRRLAQKNDPDSPLTLGTALEYYKINGFDSPTVQSKGKNLQTV